MPVDNRLYDTLADSWWDESGILHALRGLNPVRFGYMRRILRARKRGEISYLEALRRLDTRESRDMGVLYAGYAVKAPLPEIEIPGYRR